MAEPPSGSASRAHQVLVLLVTVGLTVGVTFAFRERYPRIVGPVWQWWGWALVLALVGFLVFLVVVVADFAAAALADRRTWRRQRRLTLR